MASSRIFFTCVALSLGLLPACGDDVTSATDDADETSTETGEMPIVLGGPAQGISIVGIEANQGTGVQIFADGAWVGADQRNAYLIRDRDTLIRVAHVIDDPSAWLPRNITAFLHILPGDGSPEIVQQQQLFIDADSELRDLLSGFYFGITQEAAVPGTQIWLELRESDDSIDVSAMAEGVPTLDPLQVGYQDVELQMKVMIVPVLYEHYDPPTLVELTDAEMKLFHDDLLQQNPAQTIDIQVRDEPLVRSQQLTDLGDLLGPTRGLRIQDGAPPNVYYHAMIDVRGSGVNMVAGIAWLTGPSKQDGDSRVAATVFNRPSSPPSEEGGEPTYFPPSESARTWVHEIGHNQGLQHVACPNGGAAGPDPSYPYEEGKIGVYGFGIRNYQLFSPLHAHDYMSYCGNSWVSDWTWNKTYNRIQTLTSWDFEAPEPSAPRGPTLVGFVFANGHQSWWSYENDRLPDSRGAQQLEFWAGDQLLAVEYAHVGLLSEGQGIVIAAPMPAVAPGVIDAVVRIDEEGRRLPVAVNSIEGKASVLSGR